MHEELSDSFFRGFCRVAGAGLIAVNPELRIVFGNAAAARMLGCPDQPLAGRSLLDLIPEKEREPLQERLRQAVERNESQELDLRLRSEEGPTQVVVSISPLVGEGEVSGGVAICLRDITRQANLLRSIAQTQKMNALESLAGAVAHHFNNVLGGVITSIDFAQGSDNPDALRRCVRSSVAALTRASNLTLSLLTFAEGDHAEGPCADLAATLERHVKRVRETLRARGVEVEANIEPVQAQMGVRSVETLLNNLTNNAVEAMTQGGKLRFDLYTDEDQGVTLKVSDNGPGIPEECARRIFEPFFTTKRCRESSDAEHPGLGLAVAYGIVKDSGGTISLTCRPSGGTVCSIHFPPDSLRRPRDGVGG